MSQSDQQPSHHIYTLRTRHNTVLAFCAGTHAMRWMRWAVKRGELLHPQDPQMHLVSDVDAPDCLHCHHCGVLLAAQADCRIHDDRPCPDRDVTATCSWQMIIAGLAHRAGNGHPVPVPDSAVDQAHYLWTKGVGVLDTVECVLQHKAHWT